MSGKTVAWHHAESRLDEQADHLDRRRSTRAHHRRRCGRRGGFRAGRRPGGARWLARTRPPRRGGRRGRGAERARRQPGDGRRGQALDQLCSDAHVDRGNSSTSMPTLGDPPDASPECTGTGSARSGPSRLGDHRPHVRMRKRRVTNAAITTFRTTVPAVVATAAPPMPNAGTSVRLRATLTATATPWPAMEARS
jgi:hypothetical protein